MLQAIGALIGAAITVAGLALIWTPIPVGLVLVLIGLSMLATFSPSARDRIRDFRTKHPRVSDRARQVERRMPEHLRRSWEKTDPERDET